MRGDVWIRIVRDQPLHFTLPPPPLNQNLTTRAESRCTAFIQREGGSWTTTPKKLTLPTHRWSTAIDELNSQR